MNLPPRIRALLWVTPEQFSTSARKTRAVIRDCTTKLEAMMSETQDKLDALTDSVNTGVAELKAEIDRLAALPAEQVDFTQLQALADRLASDNIPAAPAEEPPADVPADPTPAEEPPAA